MKAINQLFRQLSRIIRRAFLTSLSYSSTTLLLLVIAMAGTFVFCYHLVEVVNRSPVVTAVIIKPREPQPIQKIYVAPAKIELPIY